MNKIRLTKNQWALVDEDDYLLLMEYKWHANFTANRYYYAQRMGPKINGRQEKIKMHRFIMNAMPGQVVDHINGDTLDNRKSNLRLCSQHDNIKNSMKRKYHSGIKCTSKFKGVHKDKDSGRFHAYIRSDKKQLHIGSFESEIDAAKAYNSYATKLFGEYARLNEPA